MRYGYDPKWTEWINEMFTTGAHTLPVYAAPPFDTWIIQHPHTGKYYTVPGPEYRKYREEHGFKLRSKTSKDG